MEDNESTKDGKELLNGRKKPLSRNYLFLFVFLISIMLSIQSVNEFNAFSFISTYLQKSKLKLDKATAAYCQGSLSTAITVGRVLNIFLTIKLSTKTMLFINYFFMILGNCILMTIGTYSLNGVYVGCCLLGYGISNTYPMMITFVDDRIKMSNKIMSLIHLSTAFLMTINPYLLGKFLNTNPTYYIGLNLSTISISFTIYILLFVLEKLRIRNKL